MISGDYNIILVLIFMAFHTNDTFGAAASIKHNDKGWLVHRNAAIT